jgi:hypothetical protein
MRSNSKLTIAKEKPMTTETPTRAPRKPRRNFEAELKDVQKFCQISIEIMEELELNSDVMKGQVIALKAVQARLTVKA